jgi:DNA-binding IclR family transcriptional regulator
MSKGSQRILDILDCFLTSDQPLLGVSDVASQLHLDKSVVSRHLHLLARREWLFLEPTHKKYTLGAKMLRIPHKVMPAIDWPQIALEIMQSLQALTRETVAIHVKTGLYRICVYQLPGLYEIRRVIEEGQYLPLYAGSNGKVILAFSSPKDIDHYLQAVTLTQLTPHTITDVTLLRESLLVIRARGYAIAINERVEGVSGIAVPLFQGEHVIASLSVTGPSSRWTLSHMDQHKKALIEAGKLLSQRLTQEKEHAPTVP